jgi:hypothetical protein
MNLTVLVDSKSYAFSEIYQQHLHKELIKNHQIQYVEISDLSTTRPLHDNILVCTKFRTTLQISSQIKKWIDKRRVVVQDYDPWVFLEDNTVFSKGYEIISNSFINCSFAVPNRYWSEIIRKKTGREVHTFRLGVPPEQCDKNQWENRKNRLEFRGSQYPTREKNYEKISRFIPINWDKKVIKPYSSFLDFLSNTRIWAQDESETVIVDGNHHCRNWLWPKSIEVISRGCFLIRDRQEEAEFYQVDSLPTVFLYNSVKETPDLLASIENMSNEERNERISHSANWVKQQDYYGQIARDIEGWFK